MLLVIICLTLTVLVTKGVNVDCSCRSYLCHICTLQTSQQTVLS